MVRPVFSAFLVAATAGKVVVSVEGGDPRPAGCQLFWGDAVLQMGHQNVLQDLHERTKSQASFRFGLSFMFFLFFTLAFSSKTTWHVEQV